FMALLGGLFTLLWSRQGNGSFLGMLMGLLFGPLVGLGPGLSFGLGVFVEHFILRFLLWLRGDFPWNIVPFLDEATERLLLRRVGIRYIFVHRLLLDYFTELEDHNAVS